MRPYKRAKPLHEAVDILDKVCQGAGLVIGDLLGKDKRPKLVDHRGYCYALMREAGYPLTQIGKIFKRHHATVLYALQQVSEEGLAILKSKLNGGAPC